MNEKSFFKVEKDGYIARLILNRPDKRNTMSLEFFQEMARMFQEFDEDSDVRVVLIKAEGKTFCAGIDLHEFHSYLQGDGAGFREAFRKKTFRFQESTNAVEKCQKPVIAAVHGHCIGGGLDLIAACDIRMATRDAIFSIREVRIGGVADIGTLQRLPYIIGHGWFRELALTGRDFGSEEALQMGLVTRIFEERESLYKAAEELAIEIAALSPLAVQGSKDVILFSRDHGVYPGLEYVAQKNAAMLPSEDLKEAFEAFKQKRAPQFKGK